MIRREYNVHLVVRDDCTQVGTSGCGKSTVLRLLMRLYDVQPNCGCIRVDSQDIQNVTRKSFLAHVGIVAQDIVLFNKDVS